MKVLLVNQYFWPHGDAVAQLAADLVEDLVARGHEVTVLTSRSLDPDGRTRARREPWRGARIVRTPNTLLGKGSLPRRMADYITYLAAALAVALVSTRHDVVIATTAPPLVATLGLLLGTLRGTKFVYWLQDLYPELAVAFGLLGPRSPATWLLERISRATLRGADAVVVPGASMAARILAKGIPADRVHVVPNWADGTGIVPVSRDRNPFALAHGLAGKRVILYSGNMGRGHDIETLLGLARACRDRPDLAFVFVGSGVRRGLVESASAELPSIRLLPFVPREQLGASLSAADVHLVAQDPATEGLMEPSKLYGIMAAGRPVLYVGPSTTEVARTIAREKIGAVVANGDVGGARLELEALLRSGPTEARIRASFDAEYDRRIRTAQIVSLMESQR